MCLKWFMNVLPIYHESFDSVNVYYCITFIIPLYPGLSVIFEQVLCECVSKMLFRRFSNENICLQRKCCISLIFVIKLCRKRLVSVRECNACVCVCVGGGCWERERRHGNCKFAHFQWFGHQPSRERHRGSPPPFFPPPKQKPNLPHMICSHIYSNITVMTMVRLTFYLNPLCHFTPRSSWQDDLYHGQKRYCSWWEVDKNNWEWDWVLKKVLQDERMGKFEQNVMGQAWCALCNIWNMQSNVLFFMLMANILVWHFWLKNW